MLWGVSITKLANAVITLRRASLDDKYDMLFNAWDFKGTGKVKFREVEKGLKRLKASSEELHVEIVAGAAVKALPPDSHADTHSFNPVEFKHFTENLVFEMGQPFNVVSELLLLGAFEIQPREEQDIALLKEIKGKVNEQAKVEELHKALAEDSLVIELFQHFNTSGSGRLSFSEVAHMLHKVRQDTSLRQARAETINLMLLLDNESERSLGKIEFARFLQKISTLMCMNPQVLAGILLDIAKEDKQMTLDDSATALMMETQNSISQVYETLGDRKLHLLFELWDKDANGSIGFAEMALGLRKFCHDSEPANETAADAAEALLVFDADSDQRLDWADFARFINQFCEACNTDFSTLSEYLILLAALEDNPTEELAFLLSEDKVEKAIIEVDNLWRKDGGSEFKASNDHGTAASSSKGADSSLGSLSSSLSSRLQALSVDECAPDSGGPNEGLQRVTSDLHRNMKASPFELESSADDQSAQSEFSEDTYPLDLQGHGSSLGGRRKLGGLKSLRSNMGYRA